MSQPWVPNPSVSGDTAGSRRRAPLIWTVSCRWRRHRSPGSWTTREARRRAPRDVGLPHPAEGRPRTESSYPVPPWASLAGQQSLPEPGARHPFCPGPRQDSSCQLQSCRARPRRRSSGCRGTPWVTHGGKQEPSEDEVHAHTGIPAHRPAGLQGGCGSPRLEPRAVSGTLAGKRPFRDLRVPGLSGRLFGPDRVHADLGLCPLWRRKDVPYPPCFRPREPRVGGSPLPPTLTPPGPAGSCLVGAPAAQTGASVWMTHDPPRRHVPLLLGVRGPGGRASPGVTGAGARRPHASQRRGSPRGQVVPAKHRGCSPGVPTQALTRPGSRLRAAGAGGALASFLLADSLGHPVPAARGRGSGPRRLGLRAGSAEEADPQQAPS